MVEGLGGGRKQVIRLTVGREGERGEVEHDKIISIYIYSARLHNYYLEKLDKLLLLCLKHVIQFLNTLYPLQILEKIHYGSENSAIK